MMKIIFYHIEKKQLVIDLTDLLTIFKTSEFASSRQSTIKPGNHIKHDDSDNANVLRYIPPRIPRQHGFGTVVLAAHG